ncbi:hypothetical protein PORY_002604 [Pneumocystis oryctolagi]|uniref:Uncharacterized protein n=1 Tax=Pneumocystis oryctolagi TaxID=42067 RepID=A0ACB7C8U1_9ASCO|nr:hypothetical protein PORY_002604 [Pneumocystis oryctolagi]
MIEDLSAIFLQQDSFKQLGLSMHKEGNHGLSPDLQKDLFCGGNTTSTTLSPFETKFESNSLPILPHKPKFESRSTPSLEIWAKKIFYQSEDLQKLTQMNAERYLERHEQLETLMKTLRSDFYALLETAREEHKSRESEKWSVNMHSTVIEKQESFRRICDIVSDIIKANECKLHKLELMVEHLSSVIMAQDEKFASFEARQSEFMKPLQSTMVNPFFFFLKEIKKLLTNTQNQILDIVHQLQTDNDNTYLSPKKYDTITKNSSPLCVKPNTRKRILLTSDELNEIKKTVIESEKEENQTTPIRKILNNRISSKRIRLNKSKTMSEEILQKELSHLRMLRATLESIRRLTEKISCDLHIVCENYQDIVGLNKRWEQIANDTQDSQ